MGSKVPAKLAHSEAYYDNPEEAQKLWDQGFRPIEARELKPGMIVAYKVTDPFQFGPMGDVRTGLIGDVAYNEEFGAVVVGHDGGTTEADECSEVWARWPVGGGG